MASLYITVFMDYKRVGIDYMRTSIAIVVVDYFCSLRRASIAGVCKCVCTLWLQGENRFIESMCQTILGVEELLWVMNHAEIDNNLKRPFLRYFLWVYMKTAGSAVESGAGDLPHDGYALLSSYSVTVHPAFSYSRGAAWSSGIVLATF